MSQMVFKPPPFYQIIRIFSDIIIYNIVKKRICVDFDVRLWYNVDRDSLPFYVFRHNELNGDKNAKRKNL